MRERERDRGREGRRQREKEIERGGGERENERTNFLLTSTILFFIQPSGKTKSTKTIESKIIMNSKTHINY